MSESASKNDKEKKVEVLVRRIILLSAILLFFLMICGWVFSGWLFVRSACIGGVLASASFWMLKHDIQNMMARVSGDTGQTISSPGMEQVFFMFKTFARFGILALLFLVLASKVSLHVLGLLLGLSTIMVSVIIVGLRMDTSSRPGKV